MIMDFTLVRLISPMFFRCFIIVVALLVNTAAYAEEVTLNFSDADLSAVVNSVSQITGKNFIIDPRVKGKVTVISSKPLNEDEVYNVFLSILSVHGFATVPTKNAIKIIPDAAAKQDAAPFVNSSYPDNDQLVTQVIAIENVNATQLVPILRPLVAQQGHLAAYAETNVLIVSDRASNIKRVMRIIKQVDKKTDEELEFVRLKHAFATEVVRILSALSSGAGAQNKGAAPSIKFSADERTNSILLSGEKNLRIKYRSIIRQLDQAVESTGNIHVVYLRYANAANIAKIMGSVGKDVLNAQKKNADISKTAGGDTTLNIQADDVSNALVITAPMSIFRSLKTVIQQLDIPRAQVHIEAIIAEVSMNASNELGVQWLIDDTSSNGPALATNFAGSGSSITSLAAGISSGTGASVGEGLSLALGRIGDSSLDFVTLIRAISGDSDNNLLSTPSIVTLDNQQAEIVVGENVPFITGEYTTSTSGTSSSNPFRTVERKDVGISLKVKPQINEGNTITMEIEQEVSNLSGDSTGVDVITSKRSLKTMVQLQDGELLILGGLIDDTLVEKQQKVPGLGDVPILGALFRSSTMVKTKRNLMIFLRANIIKDPEKARNLSYKKYNSLRDYQLTQSEEKNNNPPVLEQLQLYSDQ
jgi:general secretion pathway protein D